MLVLSYVFGFLGLAACLSGATGFLGTTHAVGGVLTGIFMMLSLAFLIASIMRRDRLKHTHDFP